MVKKKIRVIEICLCFFVLCSHSTLHAMEDGAYVMGGSSSYANPITGIPEDGGTNITLGDSMISSLVEKQFLIEQTNGKTYATIGLGLASNVSNVRFKLMNSDGTMQSVVATMTGNSSANGDTVHHYRMEIGSLTQYISPILYVTPMGRDVQFFIKLNAGSIVQGTGIYKSLMIPAVQETPKKTEEKAKTNERTNTADPKKSAEVATTKKDSIANNKSTTSDATNTKNETKVGNVSKESLFEGVVGLTNHKAVNIKKENNSFIGYRIAGIAILAILALGGVVYVKKTKK